MYFLEKNVDWPYSSKLHLNSIRAVILDNPCSVSQAQADSAAAIAYLSVKP